MEQLAARVLPRGMGYDWTATGYQEKQLGCEAYFIYARSITQVFMVLAIPFVPVLYVITQQLSERLRKDKPPAKSGAEMSTLENNQVPFE
jgi:hypothetical protein